MLKKLFILSFVLVVFSGSTQPTVLEYGDLAIVAVNANDGACSLSGVDEISFLCFKDINFGTTLDFTDNGWERLNAGFWGNNEGVVRIQRTGGTILAGTVITIRNNNGAITALSPDNQWNYTNQNPGGFSGTLNLNASSGDQIYIMQGGTWNAGTAMGTHDASYIGGKILYGFSTNNAWVPFSNNSNNSGLYPSMPCFSMAPSATSDFNKYTGPTSATTQRDWLNRIGSPSNWTSYANCSLFASANPNYVGGYSIAITLGGFREGWWYGISNVWMDCKNWEDLRIPTESTDVTIAAVNASTGPFNTCLIASSGPVCHSIEILAGGALIMNSPTSSLEIYKDFKNNGSFVAPFGTVFFEGSENGILSGSNFFTFIDIVLNKTGGAGIYADTLIFIKGNSTFNGGIITHDSDSYIRYNALATIPVNASNTSHIDGKVQHVGIQDFVFPTGNDGVYQPIGTSGITNASSLFEARFFNANGPGIYGYNWGPGIDHVATCSYWTLNRIQGGSARVSLSWGNDLDCEVDNPVDLLVARWDGLFWQSHGQLSTTGSSAAGTVLSLDLVNNFSPFALASKTALNPLPVEWLYFDARAITHHEVLLNWVTATETNNNYFSIEHTTNGIDFVEIGRLNGAGNSSEQSFYEWSHINAPAGDNYYRIRQVDFNGEYDFSDSKYVHIEYQENNIQTYLAQQNIQINLSYATSQCNFILHDITGRILINKNLGAGNTFSIPSTHLSSGIYVAIIEIEGKQQSTRIVIP